MTPLAEEIARLVALDGPIPVARYMELCLLHPRHGYYTTRESIGAAGDFTTAPEISQMFGELIGLQLAQAWMDQGAPSNVRLVELGPGRGTLMVDMLRAMAVVPGLLPKLEVHLVEASPRLRARQEEALTRAPVPVHWAPRLEEVPEGPILLVANEFLDALPVRQFVRRGRLWAERVVTVRDGHLAFALAPPTPVAALAHRLADTREGDLVELRPAADAMVGAIARRIAARGGTALFIDYGDWRALGDTLQAVRRHRPENPLANPGEADLTAHVDFEAVARAARKAGAEVTEMLPQGVLLERLGITERARRLARRLEGAALEAHVAAHRRLTHPEEMGRLFKAIAVHAPGTPPPPGFTS